MAVATLLILSLMAVVLVSLVGNETFSALNQTQSLQTFDLAEAGAHRAITYLGLEAGTCTAITGAGGVKRFVQSPLVVGRGLQAPSKDYNYKPLAEVAQLRGGVEHAYPRM